MIEILKNPPINNSEIDYVKWETQIRLALKADGEICSYCGHFTGRPRLDSLYVDDEGPMCLECYTRCLN